MTVLVIAKEDHDAVDREAARIVTDRLCARPSLVLGLATGSSPLESVSIFV